MLPGVPYSFLDRTYERSELDYAFARMALASRVPTRRQAGRGRLCKWLIFGGPCRGRTYGPLIKSEAEGVAHVVDSLGNPLVIAMRYAVDQSSQFVSACRSSTGFVALPNTVLTPDGGYRPNG